MKQAQAAIMASIHVLFVEFDPATMNLDGALTGAAAKLQEGIDHSIAVHVDMLASLGGVPRQIVSDNLRAGITRACFYEPLVNRTYADMASHYGTAIVPACPYKPRDKEKAS